MTNSLHAELQFDGLYYDFRKRVLEDIPYSVSALAMAFYAKRMRIIFDGLEETCALLESFKCHDLFNKRTRLAWRRVEEGIGCLVKKGPSHGIFTVSLALESGTKYMHSELMSRLNPGVEMDQMDVVSFFSFAFVSAAMCTSRYTAELSSGQVKVCEVEYVTRLLDWLCWLYNVAGDRIIFLVDPPHEDFFECPEDIKPSVLLKEIQT